MPATARNPTGMDGAALKDRLKAWWHGYDLPACGPTGETAVTACGPDPPKVAKRQSHRWPSARLEVVQRLFGEGFTGPGGEEAIEEMIKPLAVNASHSVIEIGAGLGGMTRLLAEDDGVWATGFEEVGELAKAGMEMSTMAGLARRAPVVHSPHTELAVKPASQDAVVSKERFYTIADKPAFFAYLKTLLKARGQIMFTDYIASGYGGAILAELAAAESVAPHFADSAASRRILEELGFEIHIHLDITDIFAHRLARNFAAFANGLKAEPLSPEGRQWVTTEARLWLLRVAAIDAGALKVCRLHASLR